MGIKQFPFIFPLAGSEFFLCRMIKDLSKDIQGKNNFVFFDNFWLHSKIYYTATVLATSKEFPKFGESRVKALKRE